jgi:hypothetical protein
VEDRLAESVRPAEIVSNSLFGGGDDGQPPLYFGDDAFLFFCRRE